MFALKSIGLWNVFGIDFCFCLSNVYIIERLYESVIG